jgi:hypothetical protein
MADLCFAVIARSKATKQSILSLRGAMDCFASLAMTGLFDEFELEVCARRRTSIRPQGRTSATRGFVPRSFSEGAWRALGSN